MQPALPKEGKPYDNRRVPDPEGFSKLFGRRPQNSQEQIVSIGSQTMFGTAPGSGVDHMRVDLDQIGKPKTFAHRSGEGEASSSAAGSHGPIETSNRFTELEAARRAEEVADKAEQEVEERAMDHWEQGRRNEVLANRKQQRQAAKQKLEGGHHAGGTRFVGNDLEGSSTRGSERAGTARNAHLTGSSAFSTKGPKAAGGPVPPEPPSAREGGDLGGRAAPLGRLVQGVGRQGGPPEPLAASSVLGSGQGQIGRHFVGTADLALQAGTLGPAVAQVFPGAGDPGRAAGKSVSNPD